MNIMENKNLLIVIPARAGSKRLKGKNTLPLSGKELIRWSIDAALDANLGAPIMITSDDRKVLSIVESYDSPLVIRRKRHKNLATDSAQTINVVIDAIEAADALGFSPKIVMILQPTSPLRTGEDIANSLKSFYNYGEDRTLASVSELDHPSEWTGTVSENMQLTGLDLSSMRTQTYKKKYRLNGAIYIANVADILLRKELFSEKITAFIMPKERAIDIDYAYDLIVAESLLKASV